MKEEKRDPLDAGLSAAFRDTQGPHSVLTVLQQKTGEAPHISLREEDSAQGGASPVIDPRSAEKLALPQGKGNYQLLGEIARGGMGVVLKGHDADLGRDVALKVLHKDLSDKPEILQRFVEEAQIGGQLQHPGIVPVYELGLMADERPYFTMKLVKGRTLATLLSERESVADDRRHLLDVFESVCQTMAYAHSRGVIHRDLKPANIMVGAFGEVQVVDWGLAKVLARGGAADEKKAKEARSLHTVLETVRSPGSGVGSGSGSNSMVGSVMGTPAYMPPEQAAGMVDKLDERADVFALGAILCEILTGKPPYAGESEKTLIQAAQAELDDALERLDECQANEELVKLTKQCLMPAAATRPRNAGVLAEKLKAHLESVEERARQLQIQAAEMHVRTEEALVHAQNERKARKLTLALAASVLAIVGVGGGGWLWVQNERAVRREQAAAARLERDQREREIDAGVDAALARAQLLTEQENWNEAEAALVQAGALAAAGEFSAARTANIEAFEGRLGAAREAARFVSELNSVGQGALYFEDNKTLDEEYGRRFSELGAREQASSPEEFAAALAGRGIGDEVVPALDQWIIVRRLYERNEAGRDGREDKTRTLRLVDIANAVDDDPLRADLREALFNDDVTMLRLLAQEGLEDQPTSTLALLGSGLLFAGERGKALDVLRFGVRRHPGDVGLRKALVEILNATGLLPNWDRDECIEAMGHTQVAIALQPDSPGPRFELVWQSMSLAWDEQRLGDTRESKRWYRQARDQLEDVPALDNAAYHLGSGWVANGVGEKERALAAFRAVLDAPDMEDSHGRSKEQWRHWFRFRAGEALLRLGALEDAERAMAGILDVDNGSAFGQWVVARALQRARTGDVEGARAELRSASPQGLLRRDRAMNHVSWALARYPRDVWLQALGGSSPGERERLAPALDALFDEALALSEKSLELFARGVYWNTLAVLRYRLGDPAGALEAIEQSLAQQAANNKAIDYYVAAMAHHDLGNVSEGRALYARAMEQTRIMWIDSLESGSLHERVGFRREAAAVLGIQGGN